MFAGDCARPKPMRLHNWLSWTKECNTSVVDLALASATCLYICMGLFLLRREESQIWY